MKNLKVFYVLATSFYYTGGKNLSDFVSYLNECEEDFGKNPNLSKLLFSNTSNSFRLDRNQKSLLEYITVHSASDQLLVEMLNTYRHKFNTIKPESWNFIFSQNHKNTYSILENFYGKSFVESIFNPNSAYVSDYHNTYIHKFYNEGKLNDFFTIENLNHFYINPICHALHSLMFLEKDPNAFKKFLVNSSKNESIKTSTNGLVFENLLFRTHSDIKQLKNGTNFEHISLNFHLPTKLDLEFLIGNWGLKKTSEVVSDYINFQRQYLSLTNKKFTTTSFKEENIIEVIKSGIELKNCGSTLCMGLSNNVELISYFTITGAITKDDLLINIKKDDLHAKAHHQLLDEELTIKEPLHNNKKAKL